MTRAMGSHQSAAMQTDVWLTPPDIIDSLTSMAGPFDLDPCAAVGQPWETAREHYTIADGGLSKPWLGCVWLNPPYGRQTSRWLERLADHGNGVALIFARTETDMFERMVWRRATSMLFLFGRLHFYRIDDQRATANAGAPSVLVAYGDEANDRLALCDIPGAMITTWTAAPC